MGENFNVHLAVLMLRCLAGILFFFQGYDKVFNIRLNGVMNAFGDSLKQKNISSHLARPAILLSSFAELICGGLLIICFQRDMMLAILSFDLIFVGFIFSLIKPMWDIQYFFPRLVLIATLLLLPKEFDVFSIDYLL